MYMANGSVNVGFVIVLCCLVFMFYFFPAIMAQGRHHKHTAAIWIANFFFGWTVFGWCLLCVWAFMNQRADS